MAFALCTMTLLWGQVDPANAREDGAPASALGIADAVRASATGATGLYFNPAGIGLMRQYALEAGYTYLNDLESHALVASAVDSATNEFLGMGTSYTFIISSGKEKREGHQVRGGLSSGYRMEGFAIHFGVGVNYLSLDGSLNLGDIDAQSASKLEYVTLDAGMLLEIADVFRIGVSAQNLLDTTQGDSGFVPAPREIGVGAALSIENFQISFDAELDIQTVWHKLPASYRVGAQYLFAGMIVARLGFVADMGLSSLTRNQNFEDYVIAGGLGYVSREFGVDVGFQKSVVVDEGTIVSANFKYFLP